MEIRTTFNIAMIIGAIFVATVVMLAASSPLQAPKSAKSITSAVTESHILEAGSDCRVLALADMVTRNRCSVLAGSLSVNSDTWLRERVKSALLFHEGLGDMRTDVSVAEGMVTLQGPATSEKQKLLFTEYTKAVSGVRDVDNKMITESVESLIN